MAKPSKKVAPPPSSSGGGSGKAKKKKWSKGKTKDKANNAVIFEKAAYDRIVKEATLCKVTTPSYLVDRHHISCSLARMLLKELHSKGLINKVSGHHSQMIYARVTARPVEPVKEEEQADDNKTAISASTE